MVRVNVRDIELWCCLFVIIYIHGGKFKIVNWVLGIGDTSQYREVSYSSDTVAGIGTPGRVKSTPRRSQSCWSEADTRPPKQAMISHVVMNSMY